MSEEIHGGRHALPPEGQGAQRVSASEATRLQRAVATTIIFSVGVTSGAGAKLAYEYLNRPVGAEAPVYFPPGFDVLPDPNAQPESPTDEVEILQNALDLAGSYTAELQAGSIVAMDVFHGRFEPVPALQNEGNDWTPPTFYNAIDLGRTGEDSFLLGTLDYDENGKVHMAVSLIYSGEYQYFSADGVSSNPEKRDGLVWVERTEPDGIPLIMGEFPGNDETGKAPEYFDPGMFYQFERSVSPNDGQAPSGTIMALVDYGESTKLV